LFNKHGAFGQTREIKIEFITLLGLIAAFFPDYSDSNFGNETFPYRYDGVVPEKFLKLFFKTVGVVRDCVRSFSPHWKVACGEKSVMYYPEESSGDQFKENHNLSLVVLFFSFARDGYTFKKNGTSKWSHSGKDENPHLKCLHHYSGRTPLSRHQTSRNSACSLPPLKEIGHYEKGDYY